MPQATPPSRRLLIVPVVVLLTLFSVAVLSPHPFNRFDNPLLLRHSSTTLPLLTVNQAPAPIPAPIAPDSSSSDHDPASALFRASSAGDELTQCTLFGDLLYSEEQQGNFSATLLALPRGSPAEVSILNPTKPLPGVVRCLVTVSGPSFLTPEQKMDRNLTEEGEAPLPSDIGVGEDRKGTDLVTGHGKPITEEDATALCFGGCDIRVYQIVRVVSDITTTTITIRNDKISSSNIMNVGSSRQWRRFKRASRRNSKRNNNKNKNGRGKRRRRRRNQKQKQNHSQKLTPTSTETPTTSETGTGIETPTQPEAGIGTEFESNEKTETLTFIIIQPRFRNPCPPQPVLSPLQQTGADAEYCFEEQTTDDDDANISSFTLVGQTPSQLPSVSSSPQGNPLIRQSAPVPVPVPVDQEEEEEEEEKKRMDELCVRYNWLLWKSTGQFDYAVGYRIRVLSGYRPLDSGTGGVPPPPPSGSTLPPIIRQPSSGRVDDDVHTLSSPLLRQPQPPLPLPLPLHCSTNGVNASFYDPRHCQFGCTETTYNITSLFPRSITSSTLVQFSYLTTCAGNVGAIRRCNAASPLGPTPNNNRYPVAASFTVTDPKNDRAKAVRTALQRLRRQSSFSGSTIGGNLVVETKRINGRTYRVIFRFREQFGSEL